MRKKISIITVNLNNAAGLGRTIESVIGQTHAETIEYIVIDGGSNDGSADLIAKYRERIDHTISEKDRGIYHAMNKGIALAQGEYLLFLNSGDRLYQHGVLSAVVPELDGTDVVYGNLMIETTEGLKEGYMPDAIDLDQMMRDTLWHPVSFIRESVFTRFGNYSEDYRICGDYDFFFRSIVMGGATTKHIPVFISVFDAGGLSSDVKNHPRIKAEKEKIQKHYLGNDAWLQWHHQHKKKSKPFYWRWFR